MLQEYYNPIDEYLTVELKSTFEERKRSWIMLLIYNEKINALYANQSSILNNVLSQYYPQTMLNLASICLDSLNSTNFQTVCKELEKCHGLQKLDLSNNNLGALKAEAFQSLCNAIIKCHNLKIIDITKNNLNEMQQQQLTQIAKSKNISIIEDPIVPSQKKRHYFLV
jgi:Ran GTPase-activating protein (RanGAP) involved in mRNA processing and transport